MEKCYGILDRRTLKTGTLCPFLYDLSARLTHDTIKNGHKVPIFNVHGSKPYYNTKFIQLFKEAYGTEFRVHNDFYSVNMNTFFFFFWIGGKYYIQLSTENHETDDEYFVAALLESVLKN